VALSASAGAYRILRTAFEAYLEEQSSLLCYLLLERVCYRHAKAYTGW